MQVNPYFLPSARYPNISVEARLGLESLPMYDTMEKGGKDGIPRGYSFEPLRNGSVDPLKKKAESRVTFSDEASMISDDPTTESEPIESNITTSDTESLETDATLRQSSRQLRSKSNMKKIAQTRSASLPSNRKDIRLNKGSAAHSTKPPPGRKVPTKDASEDDSDSEDIVLSSITDAIPNLHLLLEKYKKAHGQIDKRQRLVKKLEARFSGILKSKDDIIQRLMQQSEDSARARADESSSLQSRIEALESTNFNLVTELAATQKKLADSENRASTVNKTRERMERESERITTERRKFAEVAKADKEKAIATTKMLLLDDFDTQKRRMQERYNDEVRELEDRLVQTKERCGIDFDKRRKTITEEHNETKAILRSKIHTLENKLKQTMKSYDQIREELERSWEEEKCRMQNDHAEEIANLKDLHQEYINDQIKGFVSLQERLNKAYIVENDTLKKQLAGVHLALTPPPPPSVEDGLEDGLEGNRRSKILLSNNPGQDEVTILTCASIT
jgi:hypothetical protein